MEQSTLLGVALICLLLVYYSEDKATRILAGGVGMVSVVAGILSILT